MEQVHRVALRQLGHVLGFRHEHIRKEAPAICPDEDIDNILPITVYDLQPVMHYFCGGAGKLEMDFSNKL